MIDNGGKQCSSNFPFRCTYHCGRTPANSSRLFRNYSTPPTPPGRSALSPAAFVCALPKVKPVGPQIPRTSPIRDSLTRSCNEISFFMKYRMTAGIPWCSMVSRDEVDREDFSCKVSFRGEILFGSDGYVDCNLSDDCTVMNLSGSIIYRS